jgi:uncharacterized coiled-coil protein SlyX
MKYILTLLFIVCANINYGQSIWDLTESKPNGKEESIDSLLVYHNIDISSRILINFNQENIRKELSSLSNQETEIDRLINKVIILNELSKEGLKSLPKYSEGIIAYNKSKSNDEKIKILNSISDTISSLSLNLIGLSEEDDALRAVLNDSFYEAISDGDNSWSNVYLELFQASHKYALTLRMELDQLLENEGIYVQMAATLHRISNNEKQSIHIEGFDSFEPPEFYDPYELNLTLNDKQLDEIKNLQKACDSINKIGISKALSNYIDKFDTEIIKPIIDDLTESTTELLKESEKILKQDIPIDELEKTIISLKNSLILIQFELKHLYEKYSETDLSLNVETIKLIIKDLQKLSGNVSSIVTDAKKIIKIIDDNKEVIPNNIELAISTFQDSVEKIITDKLDQGRTAINQVHSELTGYRTISEINKLSADFSDKVKKLDLKDLPEMTVLDIKNNTGYREEGDNVVLEMRSGKVNEKPKTLGKEYFTLIKTQAHIVTNVGIAFVKPNKGDENFTAVVSSNTLFKFGTKAKRTFYRKFIDVGVGVNISTLNFETDNPFEFGAAPVVSIFNDYLVSGYGYNFTQGDWYLLISIRVPFLMKELNF